MNKKNIPLLLLGSGALLLFASKKVTSNDLINAVNTVTGGSLTPVIFFRTYYPYALQSQQNTGVPAVVTLAQAAIESGYGKYAYGNNFFGIKASPSWKGEIQRLKTWECGKTGNPTTDGIKDEIIQIFPKGATGGNKLCPNHSYRVWGKFRKYASPRDSFIDHANFLKTNKRYAKAFDYTNNPNQFAIEVGLAGYNSTIAGYSTNPAYGQELSNLINKIKIILNI